MSTLFILWGLPGSGKTTYTEKNWRSRYNGGPAMVNCDNYGKGMKLADIVTSASNCLIRQDTVLDGLFTTNSQVDLLISSIRKNIEDFDIEIIYWQENREACLWNDRGRRKVNSSITIENLPFESPSQELIKKYNIKLTTKQVERKPNYKVWAAESNFGDTDKLFGSTWSLGGYSKNCYGETYSVSSSPPPISFDELDEFLNENYPNITFMQYKKIMRECVTIKESSQSDYYGGHVNYANYECDLKSLYEIIQELENK